MHTHFHVLIVLLLPKKISSFEKGCVEMDDSYVQERGCPLSPLLLKITTERLCQPLRDISPQNAQRFSSFKKG